MTMVPVHSLVSPYSTMYLEQSFGDFEARMACRKLQICNQVRCCSWACLFGLEFFLAGSVPVKDTLNCKYWGKIDVHTLVVTELKECTSLPSQKLGQKRGQTLQDDKSCEQVEQLAMLNFLVRRCEHKLHRKTERCRQTKKKDQTIPHRNTISQHTWAWIVFGNFGHTRQFLYDMPLQ